MKRAWGALLAVVGALALTECLGQENAPSTPAGDGGLFDGTAPAPDAGADSATAAADATVDAGPGSFADAAPDAFDSAPLVDSGADTAPAPDAADAATDAATDAGSDAADAGTDAPPDAAPDAAITNYALRFDDTAQPQYVLVPDTSLLNVASSFTMEAWVNVTGAGHSSAASVMGQPYGSGGIDTTAIWFESGSLFGAVNLGGTGGADSYAWSFANGTWHHVAWTFDATSQEETLYVDGASVAQQASTAGLPLYDGHPLLIGADLDFGGYTFGFQGMIDDVRVFSAVRTAGQIGDDLALVSPVGDPTLVAYYTFDEGAGSVAHDSSGHHFDGSLGAQADAGASAPVWAASTLPAVTPPADAGPPLGVDAGLEAVLVFDPSSKTECVSVPDAPAIDVATSLTYELWIDPLAGAGSGTYSIVGKPYGTGAVDSVALWFQGGTLYASVNAGSTSGALAYAWSFAPGTWHHVAFTYASAGAEVLYVDGASVAQATSSAGAVLYDANPFLIGADIDSQSYQFGFFGFLREVRVFGAVRSAAQVASDMTGASPLGDGTLVAYYPLNEGAGTVARDLSPNHLDGAFGATGGAAALPVWVSAKGPF